MPFFKNVSGAVQIRPGDGATAFFEAEPDAVVECDTNPAPGSFEEVNARRAKPEPAAPAEKE